MEKSEWKGEVLALVLCCLALLSCVAIANPFVNSAFDDDWSYSHVALGLAQTGRFHYNGWGSPTIIFQSGWAALFIRIFGFSFNILRAATLPFSVGFVCLTYLLARRVGLRRDLAQFAALILAVSPLFLPLAASFMTEPYACFFGILCIYAAILSAESENISSAIVWLWVLAISGILGGSDRQTVWIAPMLLMPYLAWLKRSSYRFVIHFVVAYLACLAFLFVVVLNFTPKYGPTEISRTRWLLIIYLNSTQAAHYLVSILLVAALMCLPALLCLQPLWRGLRAWRLGVLLLACLAAFDYLRSGFGSLLGVAPFLGHMLTPSGVMGDMTGLGTRPQLWHLFERYPATFLLLFALAVWIYLMKTGVIRARLSRPTATIFTLFTVPYLLLLVPGALLTYCYDRYAIPLLPLLLICTLLPVQEIISRVPTAGWACLLVFAIYGVATTHDYARNLEARASAAAQCTKQGISPLQISTGLERDGWVHLQVVGKIRTLLYEKEPDVDYNKFWFWFYTTSIHPDYVAITSSLSTAPKNAIVKIPFTNWAPPSQQVIYVVRRSDIPKPKI